MVIYLVAAVGVIATIFGLHSVAWLARTAPQYELPSNWKTLRVSAILLGVLIGAASWPLTYWMGYPLPIESETWRIVGVPFFVAFFDSEGRDYVGWFTMPAVIANAVFWFTAPHIALRLYTQRRPQKQLG